MTVKKSQNPIYAAQAILSRRDHSVSEVAAKLGRKGFTEQDIAKALDYLQEKKFVDDARFAKAYVESVLRSKAVGPRYLRSKLKQKGVGEEHIQPALEAAFAEGKESSLIKEAAETWKRMHPKHAEDKNRLYRFLQSRGFSSDQVQQVTSAVSA